MTGASPETKLDALVSDALEDWKICGKGDSWHRNDYGNYHRMKELRAAIAQHITLAQQAAYERAAQAAEEMNTVSASQADGLRDPRIVALDIAKEIRSLGSASALELALAQRELQTAEYILMNADSVDLNEYIAEIERRIAALSGGEKK